MRKSRDALREDSLRHGLRILGYCLMTNHVHLLAVPEREETLARAMQRTHSRYTQRYNRLHGRSGHLWQNRFFSCELGRDHLVTALAYVDLNPVRAGLVGCGEQYPWSSAGAHVSGREEAGLVDFASWRQVRGRGQWGDVLRGPAPENEALRLRRATLSGRPLGDEEFVRDLEKEAGRRLTPGRVSRPHFQGLLSLRDREVFDGPGVITMVRNRLVHSTEKDRRRISKIDGMQRWECLELALQYLELAILAICGHDGHYAKRGWRGFTGENEARVPWSQAI